MERSPPQALKGRANGSPFQGSAVEMEETARRFQLGIQGRVFATRLFAHPLEVRLPLLKVPINRLLVRQVKGDGAVRLLQTERRE